MNDRLARTRILFGDDGIAKLQRATVMVVGCGAVGSFAAEALARTGVGTLILVDFDAVAPSNINRQLFALQSTLGRAKVDVAAARIADIDPDIRVFARNVRFDDATTLDDVPRPDFVIDAIDDVSGKFAIYNWCISRDIPFISSMGAARRTDMDNIRVDRISRTTVCPLAARVRRRARELNLPDFPVVYSTASVDDNVSPGGVFGSVITVTGVVGLRLADFAIRTIVSQNA